MFYYIQGNVVDLWTKNQFIISLLAIALFGGLLLGLFVYSWFLEPVIGLTVGLVHGLVAGSIWTIIYTSLEVERNSYRV